MRIVSLCLIAGCCLLACGDKATSAAGNSAGAPAAGAGPGGSGGPGGSDAAGTAGAAAQGGATLNPHNPQRITVGEATPTFLVADSEQMYVLESGSNGIPSWVTEIIPPSGQLIRNEFEGFFKPETGAALDDENLFVAMSAYSDGGFIWQISRSDFATTVLLEDWSIVAVAVDATDVIWGTEYLNTIQLKPKAGGERRLLHKGKETPHAVASDGQRVFWTTSDFFDAPEKGKLWAIDKAEGAMAVQLASDLPAPRALVLDGDEVLVACGGTFRKGGEPDESSSNDDGKIVAFPKAGGEPRVIVDHQPGPFAVTLSPTHIYWTTIPSKGTSQNVYGSARGDIRRVPREGGEVEILADKMLHPWSIAVLGGKIYWTEKKQGFASGAIWSAVE